MLKQSHFLFCLFLIITPLTRSSCFSQSVTFKTVFVDSTGLLLDSIENLYFSKSGDYFFLNRRAHYYSMNGSKYYLPTQSSHSSMSMYSPSGQGVFYYYDIDSFYYKNISSTQFYRDGVGRIDDVITNFKHGGIGITSRKGDSLYYFLNGELKSKNHVNEISGSDDWVNFSDNGNHIHFQKKRGLNYLYLNDSLLDTNNESFIEIKTNNNRDFFYGKGKRGIPNTRFDYMFFPVNNGIEFDSVRTIWDLYLTNSGGYFCSGANPTYILINGIKYNYPVPESILIPSSDTYFFYDDLETKDIVNHSSKDSVLFNFKKVIYPSINSKGDWAFFTKGFLKTSVYFNGERILKRLKGKPVHITPTGSYYSIKNKKDKMILFSMNKNVLENKGRANIYDQNQFYEKYLSDGNDNDSFKNTSFNYVESGNSGFIFWQGNMIETRRIMPITLGYQYPEVGELFAGALKDFGYFVIQYMGSKESRIIVNNLVFDLEDEIDEILEDSIHFDELELVVYGRSDNRIIQYNIKL